MGRSVQDNKRHKTRFSSKSSRNLHKTSDSGRIGKSKSNNVKIAKAARDHLGKMLREQKRAAFVKEKRESTNNSPCVIVLFPLCASVELNSLGEDILNQLSSGDVDSSSTVASSEYKLRANVLKAPHGDLLTCMEMAKIADLMAFVVSANSPCFIDSFATQCLSVFRSIGLPSTTVLIRDLPSELKKKNTLKKMCASQLASEFSQDCKFYPADTKDELHKFLCLFKEKPLTVPRWRRQRPYVVAEKVGMLVEDDKSSGTCTLLLSGYLRARKLSVNQLVHVSGVGDFQLSKIEVLKDPYPLNHRKKQDSMALDNLYDEEVSRSLLPDPIKQEPLVVENTPDPLAGEQTWPTEEEMAEAEAGRNQKQRKPKKKILPRGTSDYQAAWIVDETDEDDSEFGDSDDDGMELDGQEDRFSVQYKEFEDDNETLNLRDLDNETQNDSETMDDENFSREQYEDEIKKIKEAHAEDAEFPDEVETPIDVPARNRFNKFRADKSFDTSSWDPNESLPQDYSRIHVFDNEARTRKQALKTDEENRDDCVLTGSYVRLHINKVPLDAASRLSFLVNTKPVIGVGFLQHESKMSVLNFSIKKYDGYEAPIKTKEELMFHVGFRQFIARPVFSTNNFRSDKHKMERFLHPGNFSLASVYGPISFPSLPLVVLKIPNGSESDTPAVAALGFLESINPNKIILKKIILTGYPQKVSKMKASVRYMFHNPEDVRWFKPVEVYTKRGLRGRVKEPVGTHGAMKCIFNGVVQQHDTVCMNLYKRVYPKWPERMYPQLL